MGQKGSRLQLTDIYQLRNQTYFTENEIREFYKEFSRLHPNGKMTKDDLQKVFSNGDPTLLVEQIFRIYDTDHNGLVDFREFLCVLSVLSIGPTKAKLQLAFSLYDQDNSGFISKEEYHNIMMGIHKAMGTLKKDEGSAGQGVQFERMDSDGDNKISFEEFEDYAKKDPKLMSMMKVIADV